MSTITRRHNSPVLLILGALIVVLVTIAQLSGGLLNGHANKHSMADTIRNCPGDKLGAVLFNPVTNRHAFLCEFSPGQWGRRIMEQDGESSIEVTAFANSERASMNAITKAIANLVRSGYSVVEYSTPALAEIIAVELAK